ncbi:MAG: OmpA family protein [Chitinophagales bacterium]|nr:OmpA family protein [Chitinophagales bacterium]
MKLTIHTLLFLILSCTIIQVSAQNEDHPIKFGFGLHAVDYNVDSNYTEDLFGNDTVTGGEDWNLDVAINRFTLGGMLNNSFSLQAALAAATVSGGSDTAASGGSLFLDFDLTLNYHLANGYILKTRSCIDPYLFAGAGVNYLESRRDEVTLFEPKVGLGFDIWLTEMFGLNIQTGYSWLGEKGIGYAHHAAGAIIRFGQGKDTDGDGIADYEDMCPTVAGLEKFNGCPDTDNDGITDASDACPTAAGLLIFNGCPDTDGDGIADKDDTCPNQAGLAEFGGCPDTDADGIADNSDRCPQDKGLAAFSGCPDSDSDGLADLDDECPKEKGLKQFNGCPDTDGDGITDKKDRCPKEKGDLALQGCPDVDGDGVADIDDRCPDKAGVKTNSGCPVISEKEKAEITKKINIAAKSIFFETNSDVIKTSSYAELDNIVNLMKLYPGTNWQIDGHTDDQGEDAFNMDLSNRRAASIKTYFASKGGIDAARLNSTGYGETKPVDTNKTAAGRSKNRRVEIKLIEASTN